jgi:hypothetical protein
MARYVRAATALSETFGSRTVILDHRSGAVSWLNASAGCIWEAVESPRTFEEIADAIVSRFRVSRQEADLAVSSALAELERSALVVRLPE